MDADIAAQECPSGSELSAWVDGEGQDETGAHIEKCPECRETVDFYASVNETLRGLSIPDDALADRIHQVCMQSVANQHKFPAFLNNPYLKFAAVLAIVAAVGLGVRQLNLSPPETGQNDGVPKAGRVAEAASALNLPSGRPVNAAEFVRLVSRNPAPFSIASENPAPLVLPQSVRHVWVVENLTEAGRKFMKMLPEDSVQVCEASSDKALCFRVVLADHQLQKLVDALTGQGWALISPALPQPGEVDRLRMVDRQVTYVAEIVAQ